ncbi:hypothetical protein [uncultured Lamprocystis sp.]|uniref:hypothetical protein n=1 Tax=uncultured Lamprocystis sp. TaxID=543132 RepID=UPI0025F99115|nr:hypothetical protein [uncultured Lamprocystis sp.]
MVETAGPEKTHIDGIGRISFHAKARADYSTLFLPPVIYNPLAVRHTPPNFIRSLMYLDQGDYAQNILQDAFIEDSFDMRARRTVCASFFIYLSDG